LHGLTGSPDELAPLADALSSAGLLVRAPMLAGHGRDVAALATTTRADWLASADAALTEVVAEGQGPAVIVGSSAGGLLALELALERPHDVRALVLLAPPIYLPPLNALAIRLTLLLPRSLRPAALRQVRKVGGPNVSDRTHISSLRYLPAYPLESLGELLHLMRSVRRRLSEVMQPVLLVYGVLDARVSRAQVDTLASELRGASVERLDLERSAHLVAVDHDRDRLARDVIAFIRRLQPA